MNLYSDNNATTSLHPEVRTAMRQYLDENFANASSSFHAMGADAANAVGEARSELANLLQAKPAEVVFTSGGTESCLMAFLGALRANPDLSAMIISAVEHPAVLASAELLQELRGVKLHRIGVDAEGRLDEEALRQTLEKYPGALLSFMLANNETGIFFPLARIVRLAKEYGALLHCDATQVVGKVQFGFDDLGIDMLSLSAHKFAGPKGVGALVLRDGCRWKAVMPGGGQESGRRGGTEAVAQIVGLGKAAALRSTALEAGLVKQLAACRDAFEEYVSGKIGDACFHGAALEETADFHLRRLPNTSSVLVPGVLALEVRNLLAKEGIVISTGSACASSHTTASPVLRAMGRSSIECLSVFRVSFSPEQSVEDARYVAQRLVALCLEDRKRRAQELAALS